MKNLSHPDFEFGGHHLQTTYFWSSLSPHYKAKPEENIYWCLRGVAEHVCYETCSLFDFPKAIAKTNHLPKEF